MHIYDGGFNEDAFISPSIWAKRIQDAVVAQMKYLLQHLKHEVGYEDDDSFVFGAFPSTEYEDAAHRVDRLNPEHSIFGVKDDISSLWALPMIKKLWAERANLGIAPSAKYFLDDLDRIADDYYRPTNEDIFKARIPTTGIRNKDFSVNDRVLNVYDVGGARSERNKWIHCFDSVTAVLFVASLTCYDQNLFELDFINGMQESLNLFYEVINSRWFKRTAMILFLNKSDLFREKIVKKDLKACFPDYEGGNNFQEGL